MVGGWKGGRGTEQDGVYGLEGDHLGETRKVGGRKRDE